MERWLHVALWITASAAAATNAPVPASWEILVLSTATPDESYAATELSELLGNVTGTAVLLSANHRLDFLPVASHSSLTQRLLVRDRSPSLVRKVARLP